MSDPTWGARTFVAGAILFAVGVVVAMAGGCVPVEAVEQARDQAANAYGLSQMAPSEDGRAIGAAELEAWRRQHVALTGEDVPQASVEHWPALTTEAR